MIAWSCVLAAAAQPVSLEFGGAETPTAATPNSPYGRRIAEVRFQPGWLKPTSFSLRTGQTLARENLSSAMNQLASQLSQQAERAARAAGSETLIFTYVDAAFDLKPPGSSGNDAVAVTLRSVHFSLPLDDVGDRVLPIPRGVSGKLSELAAGSPLLPVDLVLTRDRVLGTSVGSRWRFPILPRKQSLRSMPHMDVRLGGTKSLDAAFYSGDAGVRLRRTRTSGLLRDVTAAVESNLALEPRGTARYRTRALAGNAGVNLALNTNTRLHLDTRYARAEHTYSGGTPATTAGWRTSDEQQNRIVFDSIPRRLLGFFRAALWEENLRPRDGNTAQRLVLRAGYTREIPITTNQSIGVEFIGGAGQTWGRVEAPRRFFAGGDQGEFLFEGVQSRALIAAPDGPLVRSLGKAQGGFRDLAVGVRGGSRFWHLNLNVTLPIPRWSRPLIPNEATDLPGPDGTPQTLKQILRAQVDRTGPNMLQSTLQTTDRLTPDEAKRRAEGIFDEIRPATHFLIEQANLIAVKPLLMVDTAELELSGARQTWLAAGGGIQLTIVTAKFEAGYLRTLSGPTFGSHGNFFARLGFERLF